MNAGIILSDDTEKDCQIAFLGDKLETFSVRTNDEIVELVMEREPEVVAVDAGGEEAREELTDNEEELKEEGYIFTPHSHQDEKRKRLDALKNQLFKEMGAEQPEFIRFDPQISAEELAIQGDSGLESLGVDTADIGSAGEFDAVLGAVTARFYTQNNVRDMGIIIPEGFTE
ncbi:MAG: hypothetical protein ABEJ75_03310 [Candidatus Nanohaloarchaea archaeon]